MVALENDISVRRHHVVNMLPANSYEPECIALPDLLQIESISLWLIALFLYHLWQSFVLGASVDDMPDGLHSQWGRYTSPWGDAGEVASPILRSANAGFLR